MTRTLNTIVLATVVALTGSVGCRAKSQQAPALFGPSEMGTSVAIYATPDILAQDGASQAQIVIQARDARNQPIANMPLRFDLAASVTGDLGQLSTTQTVTAADGRATVVYTAPNPAQSIGAVVPSVTIVVTPVGTDANGSMPRTVIIRLTTTGGGIPTSASPTASFTYSPTDPIGTQAVHFNASASTGPNGISTYTWDFGDGASTSTTQSVFDHSFAGCTGAVGAASQTFVVYLTVQDSKAQSASTTRQVTVKNCR